MNSTQSWTRRCLCLTLLSFFFVYHSYAQLTDIQAGLTPVGDASLGWADYDLDDDPDLLISGHTGSGPLTTLYENNNGVFTAVENVPFIHVSLGEVVWGDYDQDGDPDVLLTGEMANGVATTQLYRNNGNGTFTDLNRGILALEESMADWGDYDGDGDLDFFIAGARRNGQSTTRIYRNDGNDNFTNIGASLVGLRRGDGQWVDYDNDGDLDLMLTGRETNNTRRTIIYQNTNGSFSDIGASLPDVDLSGIDWADSNYDGYKDLLIAGTSNSGIITHVYYNETDTGGGFSLGAEIEGVEFAAVQWFVEYGSGNITGATTMGRNASGVAHTRQYANSSFSETEIGVQGLFKGDLEWSDFDADGDADLAVAGFDANDVPYARIYTSDESSGNAPPEGPFVLTAVQSGTDVAFTWGNAVDDDGPTNTLTYNLRIGTFPGGDDVLAPNLTGAGNSGNGNERVVSGLGAGTYYWTVQSVDEQFLRSAFAPEQAFALSTTNLFTNTFPNLRATADNVHWADLDNDGDLDAILVGGSEEFEPVYTGIFENVNGQFSERETPLEDLTTGDVQLADYDNDNDLDILLQGDLMPDDELEHFVKLYRNDGGFTFTDSGITIEPLTTFCSFSGLAWIDADNNGFVDLLYPSIRLSGSYNSIGVRLNEGGVFADDISDWGDGDVCGSAVPGDMNNDGKTDVFISGTETLAFRADQIGVLKNEGNTFSGFASNVFAGWTGTPSLADYDGDGDLDAVTSGNVNHASTPFPVGVYLTGVYRNDLVGDQLVDEQFELAAQLLPFGSGRTSWGDYDADGDLDLLTPGTTGSPLWENRNGTFVNVLDAFVNFAGTFDPLNVNRAAWGDYDGDGDLDVLLSGLQSGLPFTYVYKNNLALENDEPNAPANLYASVDGSSITFNWDAASDEETPAPALTYNLRVGTTPGGSEVFSGTSLSDGTPLNVAYGNAFHNTSWTINGLDDGTYYWSVQAIDTGFRGSAFAAEQEVTTIDNVPPSPTENLYARVSGTGSGLVDVTLEWIQALDAGIPNPDATYNVRVGTSPGASDILAPTTSGAGNNGTSLERTLTNLVQSPGTYYWSVQTVDDQLARSEFASEQSFEVGNVQFGLVFPNLRADAGFATWGDLDNDGDLDAILVGSTDEGVVLLSVSENTDGQFLQREVGLPALSTGNVQLADYDNDNDLDILLQGDTDPGTEENRVFDVYRNDGGFVFTGGVISFSEPQCGADSRIWMDADNNGFVDIVCQNFGVEPGLSQVGVLLNNEGSFGSTYTNWEGDGTTRFIVAGDLNNDGLIDVVRTGFDTSVFRGGEIDFLVNEGDKFRLTFSDFRGWGGLPGVGDYDSDGDLDIITTGAVYDVANPTTGTPASFAGIYRNDLQGNELEVDQFELAEQLLPLGSGRVAWGDYDVDGDLDLLLAGTSSSPLWENRDGKFVNILGTFINTEGGFERLDIDYAEWGDYDGDGDLDILVSGLEDTRPITFIYKNNVAAENDVPFAPNNLTASASGSSITFNWDTAGDEESSAPALTYTLRVGTTPGGTDVFSPASLNDGTPLRVGYGNTYHNTSWTLNDLDEGTYYWSVQTIDTGFEGSDFAAEQSVTIEGGVDPVDITFEPSVVPFIPVEEAAAQWGDYNQDGLPDVIVTGFSGSGPSTQLYRNTGNLSYFAYEEFGFKDVDTGDVGWADYDGDGDLDLLISGRGSDRSFNTLLYRNTGSDFELVSTGLPGLFEGSIAWGDYDNDGDPDLLLTGMNTSIQNTAAIYRNDNGSFVDIGANLTGIRRGGIAWVDYDVDGDLDVMITGRIDNVINRRTLLYQNNGGAFTEVTDGLPDVDLSSVDWADYDGDGDPDLLITGTTGSQFIARIYRNDITGFADIGAGLPGVQFSDAEWGDYDADGDLDILICGASSSGRVGEVYRNDAGSFTATNANIVGFSKCVATWGDVNQDGYLEAFMAGELTGSSSQTEMYVAVPAPVTPGERTEGVSERLLQEETPDQFVLLSNYPNPFNPSTRITYNLPEASDIRLTVYDLTGKQVAVLAEGFRDAGTYEAHFDASHLASGMYLSRLETSSTMVVQKMVYLK